MLKAKKGDLSYFWAQTSSPIICRLLFCAEDDPLHAYRGKIKRDQLDQKLKGQPGALPASYIELFPLSGSEEKTSINSLIISIPLRDGSCIDVPLEKISLCELSKEEILLVKAAHARFARD